MNTNHPPYGATLSVDNVNDALPLGLNLIDRYGSYSESRGIQTKKVAGPVLTHYHSPTRRVLFDTVRDANPFFHLMESLWILSGSRSVDLPAYFLGSIKQFSDDGQTFHGAYGYRLRHYPGTEMSVLGDEIDQLASVIKLLRAKPDTRQAVMSIWNPVLDLGTVTKDMPCNDMVMLSIDNGALNMTVCNRSNDAIWGAYGANAVQFSMIQEYIAAAVGVEPGVYTQMSNNFHVYPDNPYWQFFTGAGRAGGHQWGHASNPYMQGEVEPYPLALDPQEALMFIGDCEILNNRAEAHDRLTFGGFASPYFMKVVVPAITAYDLYKLKDYWGALDALRYVAATDWRRAMVEWVERRRVKAAASGVAA